MITPRPPFRWTLGTTVMLALMLMMVACAPPPATYPKLVNASGGPERFALTMEAETVSLHETIPRWVEQHGQPDYFEFQNVDGEDRLLFISLHDDTVTIFARPAAAEGAGEDWSIIMVGVGISDDLMRLIDRDDRTIALHSRERRMEWTAADVPTTQLRDAQDAADTAIADPGPTMREVWESGYSGGRGLAGGAIDLSRRFHFDLPKEMAYQTEYDESRRLLRVYVDVVMRTPNLVTLWGPTLLVHDDAIRETEATGDILGATAPQITVTGTRYYVVMRNLEDFLAFNGLSISRDALGRVSLRLDLPMSPTRGAENGPEIGVLVGVDLIDSPVETNVQSVSTSGDRRRDTEIVRHYVDTSLRSLVVYDAGTHAAIASYVFVEPPRHTGDGTR